jgi:hypothetical protein
MEQVQLNTMNVILKPYMKNKQKKILRDGEKKADQLRT